MALIRCHLARFAAIEHDLSTSTMCRRTLKFELIAELPVTLHSSKYKLTKQLSESPTKTTPPSACQAGTVVTRLEGGLCTICKTDVVSMGAHKLWSGKSDPLKQQERHEGAGLAAAGKFHACVYQRCNGGVASDGAPANGNGDTARGRNIEHTAARLGDKGAGGCNR